MNPIGDAFLDVLGIGVDNGAAGIAVSYFQRLERGNNRQEFHAVVGSVGLETIVFSYDFIALRCFLNHYIGPAARTGIPGTAAVGINVKRRGGNSLYSMNMSSPFLPVLLSLRTPL